MKWFGTWFWNPLGRCWRRFSKLWRRIRWGLCARPRVFWVNRHRGEVAAVINRTPRRLRLSLSALAHLENAYGDVDILTLVHRFAAKGLRARDVTLVLRAGLAGAGDSLAESEAALDVEGGYAAGAQIAAQLLAAAFGEDALPPAASSPGRAPRA